MGDNDAPGGGVGKGDVEPLHQPAPCCLVNLVWSAPAKIERETKQNTKPNMAVLSGRCPDAVTLPYI